MTARTFARRVLACNAAFSILFGLGLIALPGFFSSLLFAAPGEWHTIGAVLMGIGLLVFALDVGLVARDKYLTTRDLYLIAAADIGWVLGSMAVLVFLGEHFTQIGWHAVADVAVIVALFALFQIRAANTLEEPASRFEFKRSGKGLEIKVRRQTTASKDAVWQVMTDYPRYADVADNLSRVEVLGGEGRDTRRKCYGPKGESWSETCDLYREGEIYGFHVHTDAADYPYPFKAVQGRWSVVAVAGGAEFTVQIHVQPKNGLTKLMISTLGYRNVRTLMINLAEAWARRMETETVRPIIRAAAE